MTTIPPIGEPPPPGSSTKTGMGYLAFCPQDSSFPKESCHLLFHTIGNSSLAGDIEVNYPTASGRGIVPAALERGETSGWFTATLLVEHIRVLPLKEYEFHGFTARRRVIYYGRHYDSNVGLLNQTVPIPAFLDTIRERAASFAGLAIEDLAFTQIIEYGSGAAIGWHRDRGVFGD